MLSSYMWPKRTSSGNATSKDVEFCHRPRERGRQRQPDWNRPPAMALPLAYRSQRSQAAGSVRGRADDRRQAGNGGDAVHVQMGDGCAGRGQGRAEYSPASHSERRRRVDDDLRPHAHLDGAFDSRSRRVVRISGDERGASSGDRSIRSPASAVTAFSPRAQNRRPDANSRARPQRHRDDHSHLDACRGPHNRRIRADSGGVPHYFRLALCRGDHCNDSGLSHLYDDRDQLAHRHSPLDERERHRCEYEGDRQPAQFRNRQIFWRGRNARRCATTSQCSATRS